jgi:hypothetical protein
MRHFLCNAKQKINTNGNPDLQEGSILDRTIERLHDVKYPLYPFEEVFYLPTFPIEHCYRQTGAIEIVSQESIYRRCLWHNPHKRPCGECQCTTWRFTDR